MANNQNKTSKDSNLKNGVAKLVQSTLVQDDHKHQEQPEKGHAHDDCKQEKPIKSKRRRRHRHHHDKQLACINRWYIGERLTKDDYSWTHKGYDKKSGHIVLLKFFAKSDECWVQDPEQLQSFSKQVVTEIESLKHIRHSNVEKLYYYDLNARYTIKDEKTQKTSIIDTILVVFEYTKDELFDILYYASALEEIIARTYFRQIIDGLEACHNAGIVHKDLKPSNILFDKRYNVKIANFGLGKVSYCFAFGIGWILQTENNMIPRQKLPEISGAFFWHCTFHFLVCFEKLKCNCIIVI